MDVKKINSIFANMKKMLTFALAALTALSFTGCMKSGNSWADMQPVLPGVSIYNKTLNQNIIAMEPASAGMRLAMLVSEALAQDPAYDLTKLNEVTASGKTVLSTLFSSGTTVEVVGTGDNIESYRIKFSEGVQQANGLVLSGSVLVHTNGSKSLAAGGSWNIEPESLVVTTLDEQQQSTKISITGGTTRIVNSGDTYTITINGMVASFENSSIASNWSGSFTVTAPNAAYTYSTCAGKFFKVDGSASGQSMYAASGAIPLSLSYSVTGASYIMTQIIDGKQVCKLTNPLEYDPTVFPSPEVTYLWTLNGLNNTFSCQITYNGTVYQPF